MLGLEEVPHAIRGKHQVFRMHRAILLKNQILEISFRLGNHTAVLSVHISQTPSHRQTRSKLTGHPDSERPFCLVKWHRLGLWGLSHPFLLRGGVNLAICSYHPGCLVFVLRLVVSSLYQDRQVKFKLPKKEGFWITRIPSDHELFLKIDHGESAPAFLDVKVGLPFEFVLQAVECYFDNFLEVFGLDFLWF